MCTLSFLNETQIKTRQSALQALSFFIMASLPIIMILPNIDWQNGLIASCFGIVFNFLFLREIRKELSPADEKLLNDMSQWLTELKDPALNLQFATAIEQSMVITRKNHQQLKNYYEADIQRQEIEKNDKKKAAIIEKLSKPEF